MRVSLIANSDIKKIIAVALVLFTLPTFSEARTLRVMFWNLENFFDYIDEGTGEPDAEFSSAGARRWTKKRFYIKCDAVSKAVYWAGTHYGSLPDVIGVAEVENRFVLERLLSSTALRKEDYKIIHFDSQDHRGIDVALLYRESVFEAAECKPVKVKDFAGNVIPTRDILSVKLKDRAGGEYALLVNHHPSKYSGEKSAALRAAAMGCLKDVVDSFALAGVRNIIAMGDFNDTPENPLFERLTSDPEFPMRNLAKPLSEDGKGTIRFNGRWEMIDMFFVSGNLSERSRMEILKMPFFMTRDNMYSGEKPFRTYSGPRWTGGVSDHLPIVLSIEDNPPETEEKG